MPPPLSSNIAKLHLVPSMYALGLNGEATNAQLVLYAQYSPLNFLEASEEELQRLFQQFSLTETIAQARQRVYQTVRYQKERWHNRYKSVYIVNPKIKWLTRTFRDHGCGKMRKEIHSQELSAFPYRIPRHDATPSA